MAAEPLLSVRNLKTYFAQDEGTVRGGGRRELRYGAGSHARDRRGERVWEERHRAVHSQIVDRPGKILEGEIHFRRPPKNGGLPRVVDLAKLDPDGAEMRAIRGAEIALIFQEPMCRSVRSTPSATRSSKRSSASARHPARGAGPDDRHPATVGVSSPEERVDQLSNQLSGGLRQRGDDRDGALLPADAAHCRRAHHGPRRDHQTQILELMRQLQQEDGWRSC